MNNRSLILLRYAWVALFLWFGVEQLASPATWVSYLPVWTGYMPIPGEMLVQLNGWLELVLAFMLLVGIYTRGVAILLSLHLFGIAVTAGGAIGMRDAVLGMMGISLAFSPADAWTLDAKSKLKTEN